MKVVITIILLVPSLFSQAQYLQDQGTQLLRYEGKWVSAISHETSEVAKKPALKMVCKETVEKAIQVLVYQWQDSAYKLILSELISYDPLSSQIVALGKDLKGETFVGKGGFTSENLWIMEDHNLDDEFIQKVTFNFISDQEVLVNGVGPDGEELWKVRYVKFPNHHVFN